MVTVFMVPAGIAAYFPLLSSENNMTALLTFLTIIQVGTAVVL